MTYLTSAAGGLLSTILGLFGVTAPVADQQPTGSTSGAGLETSGSCAELLAWYVDHSVAQVGPYGWNGPIMYAEGLRSPAVDDRFSAADTPVTNGPTGTNTQTLGVDEPDVAKTDGSVVVRLLPTGWVVVTDVTGTAPVELSRWHLPRGVTAQDLLLVGHHVVVSAEDGGLREPVKTPGSFGPSAPRTHLFDLDLTDPGHPVLVQHASWAGTRLALRQHGDTVRLVTQVGLPELPFVQPGRGLSQDEAVRRNRELVRSSTIEDWIPTRAESGHLRTSLDCGSVLHPRSSRPEGTISVLTLNPGSLDQLDAVAVTGAGRDVYSSGDRLYVWQQGWPQLVGGPEIDVRPMSVQRTTIHAFALGDQGTSYVGSGSVAGAVRDRWSFDERDGDLRVAVAFTPRLRVLDAPRSGRGGIAPPDASAADNGIVVLREEDGRLVQVGQVRGLGRNEEIQSVRWLGDLAVLVTFRQTDPLYTVDLSDPAHPRALGALHLPGFSSYLHPIGGGRLLGLGTEVSPSGEGGKLAVLDIGDPAHSRQLDTLSLGPQTWLVAAQDPHAFTWIPGDDEGTGTAVTSVGTGTGLQVEAFHVDRDGAVTRSLLPSVGQDGVRALPLPGGRVALAGDRVVVRTLG